MDQATGPPPHMVLVVSDAPKPQVFIGSSSEGKLVARYLQVELGTSCDVSRWDQNVFEAGGYTLDSLINKANQVDFAVLVASPDDKTVSRGDTTASVRDNVVLEFGLFAGVLGRNRTYLLATDHKMKLPTDLLGLTRLSYNEAASGQAAVTGAALELEERFRALGPMQRLAPTGEVEGTTFLLDQELATLCDNAVSQGWAVKTNSTTTLRLKSPRGKQFTLQKGPASSTREDLREFARKLRAAGLRVNSSVRRPVDQSPL
jgi:hypothetical protein